MTQIVSAITWTATDSTQNHYAAVVQCDGSVDTSWNIGVQGTDLSGAAIQALFATVDNSANNAICTALFGPFSFTVPPFTRRTFQLPAVQSEFDVLVVLGVVAVTFTNYDANTPDEQNLVAVQQATQNVAYPFITIIASRGQLTSDGNHSLIMSGGAVINYSLQQANTISNGYYNPVIVNRGSNIAAILPFAGDTINGLYTTANSLVLSPGDSVTLGCDGTTWWAEGEITYVSPVWPLATVAAYSQPHTLRQKPYRIELFLRCLTAEGGYAVGDEIPYSPEAAHGQASISNFVGFAADAANIYFNRPTWNGVLTLANKSANSYFSLTPANWGFVARAYVKA